MMGAGRHARAQDVAAVMARKGAAVRLVDRLDGEP